MPAIVRPHPSVKRSGKNRDRVVSSTSQMLKIILSYDFGDSQSFYNSSILRSSFSFSDDDASVVPHKNGFVHTVLRAWQQDLHLRLRPDDVWLAILAQFSFFVNGNAEALRSILVAHQEGKARLVVDARPDTIETVDIGAVAQQLASAVKDKLQDPNIATTLLPDFTTTTPHDRATTAMVFLGTMKEYFNFEINFGCSFPSVTLLGERSDWADMLQRVAWFGTIGHEETTAWAVRLAIVLEYMVASFDRPDDADVKYFWTRAVHEAGGNFSGGMVTLDGWLTAFCWWGADGKMLKNYSDEELAPNRQLHGPDAYKRLTLDGVEFPVIDKWRVPTGVVRIPLALYQDGQGEMKAMLLAGSAAMQVIEEEDETAARPASGWWLLAPKSRPKPGNAGNAG